MGEQNVKAHELNHLFMDKLHVCGCGRPETAAVLVRDVLRLCPLYENRMPFEDLLPNEGVQHFVLGVLTDADLIEHGGGIGGSWLTDDGKRVLAMLNEISQTDPELESVFPSLEDAPPPESCGKCYPK